jgi:predicted nucleic acid-binding protein
METAAVDTTFLIDLQRSLRNEKRQRAEAWLRAHPNTVLKIPAVAFGEFAAGFADPDDPEVKALWQHHEILTVGSEEARCYGEQYRKMKLAGNLIGANDFWIGVTALVAALPLLTRNRDHFERIEGLQVQTY